MSEPLTVEQYIARGCGVCPVCECEEIEAGKVNVEGDQAWQQVTCQRCNARWNDVYHLVSYELISETGEVKGE